MGKDADRDGRQGLLDRGRRGAGYPQRGPRAGELQVLRDGEIVVQAQALCT
jgi:hypothetical protein